MGMDVSKYIEIYTDDYVGSVNSFEELHHIGNFKEGEIVMCYEDDVHYYTIYKIYADGKITYTPMDIPGDMKECLNMLKNIDVIYRVNRFDELPQYQIILHEGDIYKYYAKEDYKARYVKWENGNWVVLKSCPGSWKHIGERIYTGVSDFVHSTFLPGFGHDSKYTNRGLPTDVTESVKSMLDKHDFGHTYITLSELNELANEKHIEAREKLFKFMVDMNNTNNSTKLDYIISLLENGKTATKKNSSYFNIYDETEEYKYIFDEVVDIAEMAWAEYAAIDVFVRNYKKCHDYIPEDNIRIIYVFDN